MATLPIYAAHAFGQVYNLPVPLWLYMYGGAVVVLVSFAASLIFSSSPRPVRLHTHSLHGAAARTGLAIGRSLSVVGLLLIIATGLFGVQQSLGNFNVVLFWAIFIPLGLFAAALIGNLWDLTNPWLVLYTAAERLGGRPWRPLAHYEPAADGYLPALVLYLMLIWLELSTNAFAIIPSHLGWIALGYSLFTLTCMRVFGATTWLRYGELFSVLFGLPARLAPLMWTPDSLETGRPFRRIISEPSSHWSLSVFVVCMLATTIFDGLIETQAFNHLVINASYQFSILLWLSSNMLYTLSLVLVLAAYQAVFWITIGLTRRVAPPPPNASLANRFAPSLIPIAVGYFAAHYSTLVLIPGQAIIRLASDPFGFGWNLFGTAGYVTNIHLLGAAQIWYLEIGLIILGHVIGVYTAHQIALKTYSTSKEALRSQYPLLILMIALTITSLWVVAQPITVGH